MKKIFIYGDSNVWGDNFSGDRIRYNFRWACRLKIDLKKKYEIIIDGVCGRTAGDLRKDKPEKNGQANFIEAYSKNKDIDVVLIALGTNDLQNRYNRSVDDIIKDLLWYKKATEKSEVIYIIPPFFKTNDESGPEFTIKTANKLNDLIKRKHELGKTIEIGEVDLSDGLHFSKLGHREMTKKVKEFIKKEIQ